MKYKTELLRAGKGLGHPLAELYVRSAVRKALAAENIDEPCQVNITFTDYDEIQRLNREFRNTDRATDVLSFPQNELEPGNFDAEICEYDPETGRILLGDMIICIPQCEKQAAEYGTGFKREVMYLAVHSTLHLLGYDHVDEGEMKKQMRAREKAIMGDE